MIWHHSWTKGLIKTFGPVNSTLSLILVMLCQYLQPLCSFSCWTQSPTLWFHLHISLHTTTPAQPNSHHFVELLWVVKKLLHALTSSLNVLHTFSVLSTAAGSLPWYHTQVVNAHSLALWEVGKRAQYFSKLPSTTKPLLPYPCFKSYSLLWHFSF